MNMISIIWQPSKSNKYLKVPEIHQDNSFLPYINKKNL